MKPILICCLSLICVFLQLPAQISHQSQAPKNNSATVVRGAYLQAIAPHSITIRWRTDVPTDSRILAGKTMNYGISVQNATLTTEHEITLSGLESNQQYFYAVGTSSEILQGDSTNKFISAPAQGEFIPVRVWATGDFGNGSAAQAAVRDAYLNYDSKPTNLWIWLGDNAYASGTDSEYQTNVFDMYPEPLKRFPLMPAPGNHDYGNTGFASGITLTTDAPYFSIFTTPQNGESGGIPSLSPKYYSYNYSNIHFVSLDSYGSLQDPGSPMVEWLKSDLANHNQRWTIVYFHHPPYTKGTHDSDTEIELYSIRQNIIPILEQHGVDLVLSGHSHSNERSYLLHGHYGLSYTFSPSMMVQPNHTNFVKSPPYTGTVYAVCGTSGQSPGPSQNDAPMPCMFFSDFNTNCSMVLDIDRDLLTAKYLSSAGTVLHEFSITKTGPSSIIEYGEVSYEITYDSSDQSVLLTCFSTKKTSMKISLRGLKGELISNFTDIPASLPQGYSMQKIKLPELSKAMYLIVLQMDDQLFSKKLLLGK